MAEYISKDRAKHFLCEHCNEVCPDEPCEPEDCDWMHRIDKEPAADVAPVVHGRWKVIGQVCIDGEYEDTLRCTNCGMKHDRKSRYCENCGAKMDLEAQV